MNAEDIIKQAWEFKDFEGKEEITWHERLLQSRAEMLEIVSTLIDPLIPRLTCLEIGLLYGGSHYLWTLLFGKIISVDNQERCIEISKSRLHQYGYDMSKSIFILGDSTKSETVDNVITRLNGARVDFLFIDADHSYTGVKSNFENYIPLVRPGGGAVICDAGNDSGPHVPVSGPTEWYKMTHDCVKYLSDNSERYGVSKFKFICIDYCGHAWCRKEK